MLGELYRCPGESCEQFSGRFPKTKGRWKSRAEEACAGCGKCDGRPPLREKASADSEVEEIVTEIADLIEWEDAGMATDWDAYPFYKMYLFRQWRAAEKEIGEIRQVRMQGFLKAWLKSD